MKIGIDKDKSMGYNLNIIKMKVENKQSTKQKEKEMEIEQKLDLIVRTEIAGTIIIFAIEETDKKYIISCFDANTDKNLPAKCTLAIADKLIILNSNNVILD